MSAAAELKPEERELLEQLESDKIPSHVFRFVERELYDYPVNKETVMAYYRYRDQLRAEIAQSDMAQHWGSVSEDELKIASNPSGANPETIRPQGDVSDPTCLKTARFLALEQRAQRIMHFVRAIDDVMNVLSERERKLVKLKYFENDRTDEEVARELGISRASFYNWRKEIVRKFAMRFGLI